jgi:hypothetical protein
MQDVVIIDPWHDPTRADYYTQIGNWCKNNTDIERIIIASYEDPRVDFTLYSILHEDPRTIIDENFDANDLNDTVWLLGQSWQACVHARPLGIPYILRAEKNIFTKVGFLKKQTSDGSIIDVDEDMFLNDWYVWSQDGEVWQCIADEKNVRDAISHITAKENNNG